MTVFLFAFIVGLLAVAWLVSVGVCLTKAADNDSWKWAAIAAIVFVVPIAAAIAVAAASEDPHASVLCVRGHEEWRTERGVVMVGKVMVPTDDTHKVWVCESWQAEEAR